MKKTYKAPSLKVANINLPSIMAGSDPVVTIDKDQHISTMDAKGAYTFEELDDED